MPPDSTPPATIDAYVAEFPRPVQQILQRIRRIIRKAAPDAEETIKYGIPTFVWHGNLVHFAAFAHHVGFYPTPSGISQFKEELSAYKSAKGSVQFPLDAPIPYDLIERIVAFRVRENAERAAGKRPRGRNAR